MASKKKGKSKEKRGKKNEKPRVVPTMDWLDVWCAMHVDKLRELGSGWATVHPKHGVVGHDTMGELRLIGRNRFLKRSIVKECRNINVMERLAAHVVPAEAEHLRPDGLTSLDPFDNDMMGDDVIIDGAGGSHHDDKEELEWLQSMAEVETASGAVALSGRGSKQVMELSALAANIAMSDKPLETMLDQIERSSSKKQTLNDFALERNLKPTEVLLVLLEHGSTGVHINTELDEHMLEVLNAKFTIADHGSLPERATTSPHKQPPFQPYRPASAARTVLDGYGRKMRNLRVD